MKPISLLALLIASSFADSEINPPGSICGGETGENKDACHGDSGGPLVIENNGKLELAGITSGMLWLW
ncbi:unnamed protein product [Brachionus calyciflorus]|uniref:Peptidase S1 domain-containing protein n=1 Tax=Brachionus calyciflorus TaxID=104777 RepID=A0A814BE97_9BILA|nr:unnamed protein product [Brachionus calyciflorus]